MNRSDERLDRRQRQIDRMLSRTPVAVTLPSAAEQNLLLDITERAARKDAASAREDGRGRPGFGPVPSLSNLAGAYSANLGARMERGFGITKVGGTGGKNGRPLGQQIQRVRLAAPGALAANKRTWAKVKKSRPSEISEKLWYLIELHYGHGYKPWQIAEQLKPRVKERSVSQALVRARKLAAQHGIYFQ